MTSTDSGQPQVKVSVAMTTYNHEPFIAQAIESVLMQQTDFAVELIIGEDCSRDGTRAIVRDFAERYPARIRALLPEQNQGAHANCEAVFALCDGQYIAYLEGDDYWTDPFKLQKQVALLDQHPEYSVAFHRVRVIYEGGTPQCRELGPEQRKAAYSLDDYLRGNLMQAGSIVVRGDLFLQRPEWYYQAPLGDWAWIALLAEHGELGYIDEVMGVYRKHPGGVWSGQRAIVQLQQQLLTLKLLDQHFAFRHHGAIAARVSGICAAMAQLLISEELDAVSDEVSAPAVVLERSGAADYLSAVHQTELLGEFYASLLFALVEKDRLPKAYHCLGPAVRRRPALLRNRGVWSVAGKALLAAVGLKIIRQEEVAPAESTPAPSRAQDPVRRKGRAYTIRCLPSSPDVLNGRYMGELVRGLEREGFPVVVSASAREDLLDRQWLVENAGKVDVLHFHWTQYQYDRGNTLQNWKALAKYFAKLVVARRLGYRIVWTMHNYMPHEPEHPLMHRLERLFIARWADAVIVLCARGRELLRRRLLRAKNVFVIPHGDFTPFMEHPDRATSRQQIGLGSDDKMLLFFGSIRPYKGVPELIEAFSRVGGDSLKLFVAGKPLDEALRQEIEALAALDPRIRLRLQYVPEADLCALLSAADAAVLPYRTILGSSALMTALGYGLPVIAPLIGSFPEIVGPECGILYDPATHSLADALARAAQADLRAMGAAALARAQAYPWEEMIRQTGAVYTRAATGKADELDPGMTQEARPVQG